MRLFSAFLLCAAALFAEDHLITGMGARLIIGQTTFTASEPGASATRLGAAGGVAFADDLLVVADGNRLGADPNNNRVLLYKNASQFVRPPEEEVPQNGRCNVCVGEADVVLGQADFDAHDYAVPPTGGSFRTPVGVATDGTHLAVADTDNNRVLIWNSIPLFNGTAADVVLGQTSFDGLLANAPTAPRADSLRGPQGVWFQNGKLFVADSGNNRVLIWNSIPSANGTPADIVLGRTSFTDYIPPNLVESQFNPQATTMLTPTSVTSDGQRLYVTDLGHNRVLIWNSIPTQNTQPADIVIGQPDMTSGAANNTPALCDPLDDNHDGQPDTDAGGNILYPLRCGKTLDFPRFTLSNGKQVFVSDGGNDRILVFDQIPTENGVAADHVIGQIDDLVNNTSDSAFPDDVASAGAMRTPTSLAWDGRNLYVADPFNRRVLVFTMAEELVASTGVRNAASLDVFAGGSITLTGTPAEGDVITVDIADREYTYTVQKDDLIEDVAIGMAAAINAGDGDPDVLATPNPALATILLTARVGGIGPNDISYSVSVSTGSSILPSTGGTTLLGGGDAARIAPGAVISVIGQDLTDQTAEAPYPQNTLPNELGGVQVYIDGVRVPLFYVSPTQINAQMPVEFQDTTGVSAYVRSVRQDGRVVATNVVPVGITPYNPGLFANGTVEPRKAVAFHASSHASSLLLIDGSATAGDTLTITIGPDGDERTYSYTVVAEDVPNTDDPDNPEPYSLGLERIRDKLLPLLNQDPVVEASATGQYQRIILQAREPGQQFEGYPWRAETNDGATEILTATTPTLCCVSDGMVTEDNPAVPGEFITLYGTGLGLVDPDEARQRQLTGQSYDGPELNTSTEPVSSLLGGRTANVMFAGLDPGGPPGLNRIDLQILLGQPTNPFSTTTIAQGFRVSNIVTIPVFDDKPLGTSTTSTPSTFESVGQVLDFSIQVSNNGKQTVSGPFTVTASKIGSISCEEPDGSVLAASDFFTCTGSYTITQADLDRGILVSTVSATATLDGKPVGSQPERVVVNKAQ